MSHDKVEVAELPKCSFCSKPALYDCRLEFFGTWGNVCSFHFEVHNCKLGLGLGQELILVK